MVVAPIPAAFTDNQYSYIARVLLFLVLSAIAAYGAIKMRKAHKRIYTSLLVFFLYELVQFNHDIYTHYITELAQRVFKI